MTEVEETIKRIKSHKGVLGVIVLNQEGQVIRTTFDNSATLQYASLMHGITGKTRSAVRDLDAQNDLTFIRIRTKKNEIMIAPDKDFMMVVVRQTNE